jgi:hypothetical protein
MAKKDLIHVVNRTALLENLLNQVIERFCKPKEREQYFFWNVVLDSSIMPLGSKARVAMAIAQIMRKKLDQNSIHTVIALRNAFAHHKTSAHPVMSVGAEPGTSEVRYEHQVINSSGKVTRKRRESALTEFNSAYDTARESLIALRDSTTPVSTESAA